MKHQFLMGIGVIVALCLSPLITQAQVNVLTQHNDNSRTGTNQRECPRNR
jgi:hypothetical protein